MPAGKMYVHSFISASVRLYTANIRLNLEAPFLLCWQGTFTCQFSSKSSTSLTFIFKFKYLNRIHRQVNISEISVKCALIFIGRRMMTIATMSRRVRIRGRLPFAKICQGVLAYSLIFKRNVAYCILAYSIRWSVSVCVVCACSSVCTPHWWIAWKTVWDKSSILFTII